MKKLKVLLAIIGIILIINNFVGVFVNMRNPAIYTDPHNEFPNDITLTEAQFYQALDRVSGDRVQTLTQINAIVNQGIAHNWRDDAIEKYHLRVPFYENFILFGSSYLYPALFLKYQFVDYHRAVERGVGLCSEEAFVLTGILGDKGIKAKIVGLSGHVVVSAPVDDAQSTWWIFDPDYGVVIPNNISQIEENPELVRPYYAAKGYTPQKIDSLVSYYGEGGNKVVDGIVGYSRFRYYYEYASYIMIWVIPVVFILPFAISVALRLFKKGNFSA
ncbi:MAG: hypothetical protein ABSE06_00935 [Anaerolineaceae bacterium]